MRFSLRWRQRENRDNGENQQQDGDDQEKVRQLWGQEFNLVKEGLSVEQVQQFVNDLLAQQRLQAQRQERTEPMPRLVSKRILAEAERDAADLRVRAKREAEAEATRLLTEAQQRSQGIVSDARKQALARAEQEAQSVLDDAHQRADLLETEALRTAHLFLLRAREEIQGQLASETKEVYHRLLSSLQDLMSTAQTVETDWASRKIEPWWGRPSELKDYQATLLDSLMAGEGLEGLTSVEALTQEEDETTKVRGGPEEELVSSQEEEIAPLESLTADLLDMERSTEEADEPIQEVPAEPQEPLTSEQPDDTLQTTVVMPTEAAPLQEETLLPGEVSPGEQGSQREQTPDLETVLREIASSQEQGLALEERLPQEEAPARETVISEETRLPVDTRPATEVGAAASQLYSGEVELLIAPPVSAARVTTLYNHLQSSPELKILRTAGSWDRGTVVDIELERPMPLLSFLSDIPALEVVPGGGAVKGVSEKGRPPQRISLAFKDQDVPS